MPTHVTYVLPGHHGTGEGMPPCSSMTLTVHSQVTFPAPRVRNKVTMCCHAATKFAGDVRPYPHERHDPFISWPKLKMTGRRYDRTATA